MVKCNNCGFEAGDTKFCPKCGNNLQEQKISQQNVCSECGSQLKPGASFCPTCGNKIELEIKTKKCSNCGSEISDDSVFCSECGANILTGEKPKTVTSKNQGFVDKINLESLVKPVIVSLVVSIIISVIGVLIGFSWFSFILAIVISVGFFAGLLENDANAIVFGFFEGLILGILELPIFEFCWGPVIARIYQAYFGSQILVLIIFGIILAYISNVYFKSNIENFAGKYLPWLNFK